MVSSPADAFTLRSAVPTGQGCGGGNDRSPYSDLLRSGCDGLKKGRQANQRGRTSRIDKSARHVETGRSFDPGRLSLNFID